MRPLNVCPIRVNREETEIVGITVNCGARTTSCASTTNRNPLATIFCTTQMIYFEPIYQTKSIYLVIDFHAMNFQKPHHVTHQWTSRKGKL